MRVLQGGQRQAGEGRPVRQGIADGYPDTAVGSRTQGDGLDTQPRERRNRRIVGLGGEAQQEVLGSRVCLPPASALLAGRLYGVTQAVGHPVPGADRAPSFRPPQHLQQRGWQGGAMDGSTLAGGPPLPFRSDPLYLDPGSRPGLAIKRAEQALMQEKARALRALGLTVPQYAAMLTLSQFPGSSGAQLARRCHVTPQSMASLLATLERKALVSRAGSAVHAKVHLAHLTEAGTALLAEADRAAVAVERRLASAFTATELDTLRSLLTRAAAALSVGPPDDAAKVAEF